MPANNPTHPSISLTAGLEEMGWSVSEFADRLEMYRGDIAQLMNGRCGIPPALALALERIGWSDGQFWVRRQANYDLTQARREEEAKATAGN